MSVITSRSTGILYIIKHPLYLKRRGSEAVCLYRRIAMDGYVANIEKKSLENKYFREVLFTGPHSQLVVMSIAPGEDIGMETHKDVDQFFRVEAGIFHCCEDKL
jgi:hypothetical protein